METIKTINVGARTDFRRYVILVDMRDKPRIVNYALAADKYRVHDVLVSLREKTVDGDKMEWCMCYVDEFDDFVKFIDSL